MALPLRLLLVEDSADDADLILHELRRAGYDPTCERVQTAAEMKAALAQRPWDLVIADYVLPHFSAPGALTLVQESGLDLPFIVVSGAIGEETAVQAMRAGARDYIMKGNLARLAPAIVRELHEAGARRERKAARRAAPAGAEARGHRSAGGWRGPRLQQPADGHQQPLPVHPRPSPVDRALAPGGRPDPRGRPPGCRTHPAAPGLQPRPTPPDPRVESQLRRCRDGRHAPAPDRRTDRPAGPFWTRRSGA